MEQLFQHMSLIANVAEEPAHREHQPHAVQMPERVTSDQVDANFQYLISKIVAKHDNTMEPERYKKDYTHVSSLKDMCTRRYALVLDTGVIPHKKVHSSDRFVWAMGRTVENHIRSSYIEAVEFHDVYGIWKCRCGESEQYGFHNDKIECLKCFGKLNRYSEYVVFNDEYQIVGNPDFILYLGKRGLRVIEIKSIKGKDSGNGYGFDTLARPLGDHIFQALMYRWLLKAAGKDVDDYITLVYANKDYVFSDNPEKKYKEYIVDATSATSVNIVNQGLQAAREIMQYRTNKTVPVRTLCNDINCSMAKQCPVQIQCFTRQS